jgi:two-component system, LytTR family, response regulator
MIIHAVLADDEVLARQKLRRLLRDEPEIEIVGECATAPETIELVRATGPGLLFLDIPMPGMDGFHVVGALSACRKFAMPSIIFTTAYDQFALRAFEIHAVDYLLKPFTSERLHFAVARVIERARRPGFDTEEDNGSRRNASPYSTRIVFKSRGRIIFLPVSEIRSIQAEENNVRLCTEKDNHLLRETMAHLEERLDPELFLRVHRSSIVNLQYVKEILREPNGEFVVVLVDGQKLPMSRTYRSRISEWMIRG